MAKPLFFNWSTGKDSALALYHLLKNPDFDVQHLLTSVNAHHNRVSMHGLRRDLLKAQLHALGIPSSTIELPESPTMDEYNSIMEKKVSALKNQGFSDTAFGDIFLEDLREYREKQLAEHEITAHFPLWKRDTTELIREFIDLGFRSIVVCCNGDLMDETFVGREINQSFVEDLPENVDPCGENGEFHTFCFDGPVFKYSVEFEIGDVIKREYPRPNGTKENPTVPFWFCDLLPKQST